MHYTVVSALFHSVQSQVMGKCSTTVESRSCESGTNTGLHATNRLPTLSIHFIIGNMLICQDKIAWSTSRLQRSNWGPFACGVGESLAVVSVSSRLPLTMLIVAQQPSVRLVRS